MTANVLFAVHLDTLAQSRTVRAFALHRGRIRTNLVRHLPRHEMIDNGFIDRAATPSGTSRPPPKGPRPSLGRDLTAARRHRRGLLEDCEIAEPATADGTRTGVRDYAIDPTQRLIPLGLGPCEAGG